MGVLDDRPQQRGVTELVRYRDDLGDVVVRQRTHARDVVDHPRCQLVCHVQACLGVGLHVDVRLELDDHAVALCPGQPKDHLAPELPDVRDFDSPDGLVVSEHPLDDAARRPLAPLGAP